MIDYKKKYKKYKHKYIQYKLNNNQHGGIRPFRITGPVMFYIYKVPSLDKIFYLFGDKHFQNYRTGCEVSDPEYCDMQPDCYDIKTFINEMIYTNNTNIFTDSWIDIFLETYYYQGDTTDHRIIGIRNILETYNNRIFGEPLRVIKPIEYTLQKSWYNSPLGEVIGLFTKCIKYNQCPPFTRVHMIDIRGGDDSLSYYTEYIKEITNIINKHSKIKNANLLASSSQHIKHIFRNNSTYVYRFKKMMNELRELIGIDLSQTSIGYEDILLSKLISILGTTKMYTEIHKIADIHIKTELISFIISELKVLVHRSYIALWDNMSYLRTDIRDNIYNDYPDVILDNLIGKSQQITELLSRIYNIIQPMGTIIMDFYAIARMFKLYPKKIIVYTGYLHTKTYIRFLMRIRALKIFKSTPYRLTKQRCIEVSLDHTDVLNFDV